MKEILFLVASLLHLGASTQIQTDHPVALQSVKKVVHDPFLAQASEPKPVADSLTQLDSFIYKDNNHFGFKTYEMDDTLVIVMIVLIVLVIILIVICCCFCCASVAAGEAIRKEVER